MKDTTLIAGAETVVAALGFWPSFHDAEVVKFSAERSVPVEVGSTFARMVVHVRQYAAVGEGTAQYQQVLVKSARIHLLFSNLSELELSGFNHQNVINAIAVTRPGGVDSPLLVEIESIWGVGGSMQCASASVEAVEALPNAAA